MGLPTASRDVLSWESSCFKCLNVTVSAIFNDNKCIKTVSPASNYGKNRALRVKRPQRYSFFLIQPIILRFDMFLGCREYAVMSIVPYFLWTLFAVRYQVRCCYCPNRSLPCFESDDIMASKGVEVSYMSVNRSDGLFVGSLLCFGSSKLLPGWRATLRRKTVPSLPVPLSCSSP